MVQLFGPCWGVAMPGRFKEYFVKSSDPYERGLQHGRQAAAEIISTLPAYQKLFTQKGLSWEEIKASAMCYEPYLRKKGMSDLLEEIRGIAVGCGLSFEEIMVLNVRYELMKCPKPFSSGIGFGDVPECTGFLVLPEASKNHETISGQNWDMLNFCLDTSYILHIDEENGTRVVAVCEPGQLLKNGMNSHGVSNTGNNLVSTKDTGEYDSTPLTFLRRRLLQQKTFEEAEKLILNSTFRVSMNSMIASKEGKACDFEITPDGISQLYPEKGVLGHGNDITSRPDIDADSLKHPSVPDGKHFRGQRLHALLLEKSGVIDEHTLQTALSDHHGFPLSVCNHEFEDREHGRTLQTLSSAIYLLDRGYALICKGNPCCGEYVRYEC